MEQELESVGENMKSLEKSAEKALEREEKLKDKILQLQNKYKAAEARYVNTQHNRTLSVPYEVYSMLSRKPGS